MATGGLGPTADDLTREALAAAARVGFIRDEIELAACMGMDVVDIIRKGRHALTAFRTSIVAERQQQIPHRLTKVSLHFHVHGDVPVAVVERAIALSRDKYCSVWHSLREDIELTTSFDITAGSN